MFDRYKRLSKLLSSFYHEDGSKRIFRNTRNYGVASQKIIILIFTAVRSWNLKLVPILWEVCTRRAEVWRSSTLFRKLTRSLLGDSDRGTRIGEKWLHGITGNILQANNAVATFVSSPLQSSTNHFLKLPETITVQKECYNLSKTSLRGTSSSKSDVELCIFIIILLNFICNVQLLSKQSYRRSSWTQRSFLP
jgi:hypothetical protein